MFEFKPVRYKIQGVDFEVMEAVTPGFKSVRELIPEPAVPVLGFEPEPEETDSEYMLECIRKRELDEAREHYQYPVMAAGCSSTAFDHYGYDEVQHELISEYRRGINDRRPFGFWDI